MIVANNFMTRHFDNFEKCAPGIQSTARGCLGEERKKEGEKAERGAKEGKSREERTDREKGSEGRSLEWGG